MQAEMLANPTDGIVDLTVFVRAQIEGVHLTIRLVDRGKNSIDTILDVQIRFLLMAVAQHMKCSGCSASWW